MNPFGLPNFQIPITINGITNKVWYFYWAKIGQTLANQVALPAGSYTNTNLTVNANGVISAISSGATRLNMVEPVCPMCRPVMSTLRDGAQTVEPA